MSKAILYFIIGAVVIFGYIKYIESRAIYLPFKGIEYTPEIVGLPFEDTYIDTEDHIHINGWFVIADNARATILFCHGNGGNIAHRLEKMVLFHNAGLNTFIIDYRGYGMSGGSPSERGLYLDAQAAYDYLVNERNIAPEKIIVYGESLGTGVIIDLASKKKVGGLIIEGGFSRGRDMAKVVYPFFPAFLFANSFDSLSKIEKIDAPKLFIHSKDDEVVPLRLAKKLYAAAGEPKHFVELRGGHNSAFFDCQQQYASSIKTFIEQNF